MEDAAASESLAHYPPGSAAPQARDRVAALKDPDRLAKLNAGKAEWYAKPLAERRRITAEKQAAKARRAAEREAKRAGQHGAPPPSVSENGPDTVRSQRSSLQAAPPESEIPRPGVRGSPLKGLLDICEALPSLGGGSTFVQVNRLKPTVSFGTQCAGVQKPLWEAIDDAEFAVFYGGGEYVLRGYQLREDGRAKALTEPVPYKVPGNPNLESALTEEDAMRPQAVHVPNGGGHGGPPRLTRPGVVTPHVATAEAEMFARELEHKETMDERNARRAEERRRREEEREQARREADTDALKVIAERTDREVAREREMYEQRLAEKGGSMAEVAELVKALQPQGRGEDTQVLVRQHAAQIQQLTESNKQELLRLSEQHRHEVQRITDSHTETLRRLEDQSRADRDRADKLVRDTEQRSNELIRAAEQRADARVLDAQTAARTAYDDLRTRSEERLRDQNQQWQQRFDDLKENHAREIRQKDSELNLMRTGLEGNMQVILAGKDTEIKRLQSEVRQAKEEAEKNKDFVAKLGEFERQAEALGFQKAGEGGGDGESDDLKTTVIKGAVGALQNLPQIIDSASNAIRGARNPASPPDSPGQMVGQAARGHTRALPRPAAPVIAPLTFATEDGGYVPPPSYQPPPVRRPAVAPLEQSPTQPIITVPDPQLQLPMHEPPPPQQHAAAPEQQQMSPAPQNMAPNPAPSMPPPPSVVPAPPAPSSSEPLDPMTLGIIQGLAPDFAGAFTQRVQPQQVVEHLIANNGIENVRAALAIVTIDQVLEALGQDQNPAHGVLKTRNGQKFLRAVWQAAEKAVAQ